MNNLKNSPSIVWFRQDLRLADNPAFSAAAQRNAPIIPLYIWSEIEEAPWAPASASKVWLHQSLIAFNNELEKLGLRLILRQGEAFAALQSVIEETNAGAIFWNRRYEPKIISRDKVIKSKLKKQALMVESFNGSLIYEPWEILQKNEKPYQVYSAYWRACLKRGEFKTPIKRPEKICVPKSWPLSLSVIDLELMPKIHWADKIMHFWPAGSFAAQKKLNNFIKDSIANYSSGRDRPDLNSVSYLSPYLHLGQLSPRQILSCVEKAVEQSNSKNYRANAEIYLKEIFWREFAYYLLFHFPHTTNKPLREQYAKFPWRLNNDRLRAWQKGETGYPIVDAGMRQLWQLGWMHNRVRMIVASFLVKDLLIPWQSGAKWFWDTLVDADLANNTLGWQWSAGCGADAAPYFRVFNPVSQSKKFDPDGMYIKKFVPELKHLAKEHIHAPWLADEDVLQKAQIILGKHYPKPIVSHDKARLEALAAWRHLKDYQIANEKGTKQ